MNEDKITPLADVSPIWERDSSIYPDLIRIPMSDGKVVAYRMDVQQPHPSFDRCMQLLDGLPVYPSDSTPGYKGAHEKTKKPNLWERIQAVRKKGE